MLKRTSRQSIANFVMCGAETLNFVDGSFDERLREGEKKLSRYLDGLRITERERDELAVRRGDLLDLYFQEGVKIGALLVKNLTE